MERKDFIKKFAVSGSILFATPAFLASCSDGNDEVINSPNGNTSEVTIDLTKSEFSALGTIGGYAYSGNVIIVRTSDTQYTVLSKICTHQGCTVTYNSSNNQLPCPCHGSIYNISGGVVSGPATQSLKQYSVKINGNTLVIT